MSTETTESPRIYLSSVHLKGFKSIEDLTIDFQKGLNILIGKNGSGKSNFMEFLYGASTSFHLPIIQYQFSSLEFVSQDNHRILIEFTRPNGSLRRDHEIFGEQLIMLKRFKVDEQIVFDSSQDRGYQGSFIFKEKKIFFNPYNTSLKAFLHKLGYPLVFFKYIKFDLPTELDCINKPGNLTISQEKGLNAFWDYPDTLSVLLEAFWKMEKFYGENDDSSQIIREDVYNLLQFEPNFREQLTRYSPIEDIRFNHNIDIYPEEKYLVIANLVIEFKINNNWLNWSQLSDGTKRLFCIISEVEYSGRVILIEEPELGIHPHQFNLLMDFLKEQSQDKQIIISTHSPQALDILSPDELDNILITYYDKQKGTQIRHLDEHEKKKAKLYMKEVGFFSDYWLHSNLEE